jgi:spore protease
MCAVSPGVLGITGIETYDIIAGLVDRIRPDAVIAVDTLASRSVARLAAAYQVSDTGITPGAGVGNRRFRLDKDTLGVPVIAVGVPLVVFASTIAEEALTEYLRRKGKRGQSEADAIDADKAAGILGDLVVTPKDIDAIVKDCAYTLALAINSAVHDKLSPEEITGLMS